jgi:hypothetical protein
VGGLILLLSPATPVCSPQSFASHVIVALGPTKDLSQTSIGCIGKVESKLDTLIFCAYAMIISSCDWALAKVKERSHATENINKKRMYFFIVLTNTFIEITKV